MAEASCVALVTFAEDVCALTHESASGKVTRNDICACCCAGLSQLKFAAARWGEATSLTMDIPGEEDMQFEVLIHLLGSPHL